MTTPSPHNKRPSDHDPALEADALWETLGKSPGVTPSPSFVTNTVRAARLSQPQSRVSVFLERLRQPSLVLAASCAAVVIGIGITQFTAPNTPVLADNTASQSEADAWLDDALLSAAAETPELFTEAEIVALIF